MELPIGVTHKSKQWTVMWCDHCEAKYVYGTTGRCPDCLSNGTFWESVLTAWGIQRSKFGGS